MLKVILVYTKTGWDVKNVTTLLPLSVLYLGKPLRRAGYTPIIIDQRIDPHWERSLRQRIREGDVAAVGISAMTGLQIKWGLAAAAIARQEAADIPLVWGGVHPTLLPDQTARHPLVDYVVWREGEKALVDLLDALKDTRQPAGVPGVAYASANGDIVRGPDPDFIDLGDALIPDYDLVNVPDYVTTQTLGHRDLAIMTSRGCPHRCIYCYNTAYGNRHWRAQPAEAVAEHIERIVKSFGLDAILVKDDNFFASRSRVISIAEQIRRRGLKVTIRGECRADYIADQYDIDLLRDLYDAGFRELTIGAEVGTDEALKQLQKDLSVQQIREASNKLRQAKIAAKFTFLCGFPGETDDSLAKTLDLMLELIRDNPFARVTPIHLYAPFPGTEMFDRAVKLGFSPPAKLQDWSGIDFHSVNTPWIDPANRRRLERMSVSTYFLDGRTMPEYFAASPVMKNLSRIYGAVVRWRARFKNFRFMPELWLVEQYKKLKSMA